MVYKLKEHYSHFSQNIINPFKQDDYPFMEASFLTNHENITQPQD